MGILTKEIYFVRILELEVQGQVVSGVRFL